MAQSKRLGYSAVNTARSALSTFITIDGVKAGAHPLISRFMTGVFNQNPALPRYVETWDPQIVVSYLESFPDFGDITLKQLALKLAMLLALTTAQRIQTLKALSIADMEVLPDRYVFRINCLLKQTSSKGNGSRHLPPVVLKEYSHNKKLCVVELLKEYLCRTGSLRRGETQLLLCHTKPHGAASKDTIGRWLNLLFYKLE